MTIDISITGVIAITYTIATLVGIIAGDVNVAWKPGALVLNAFVLIACFALWVLTGA